MRQFQSAKDYIYSYIDKLVFKYMNKYGIDNVRGGSYTDLILLPVQYQFISSKTRISYIFAGPPNHLKPARRNKELNQPVAIFRQRPL